MKELNRCEQCGQLLVTHSVLHAIEGRLYCSKDCAIEALVDEYVMNAKEMALETYASMAEVVSTDEILSEDFYTIELTAIYKKRIKLPRTFTERQAIDTAMAMYNNGLVDIDDSKDIHCELVEAANSAQNERDA